MKLADFDKSLRVMLSNEVKHYILRTYRTLPLASDEEEILGMYDKSIVNIIRDKITEYYKEFGIDVDYEISEVEFKNLYLGLI